MDSAKSPVASNIEDYQPLEQAPEEGSNLLSRKFIITILGITIFGLFTALGRMDIETYMYFFGGITAGYFGVNFMQKKM